MNTLNKALIGTAAAAAMAVSATPAMAKHRDYDRGYHKKHKKIGAGEIIAGAIILGGIAAIATSGNKRNRDYRYDNSRHDNYNRNYNGYNHQRYRIGARKAIKRCKRATRRQASHYGRARVTEIFKVKETRDGWKIKGRVAVNDRNRRYGNYGHNPRGYYNGYDEGKFTCYISGGRVQDVRLRGIGGY